MAPSYAACPPIRSRRVSRMNLDTLISLRAASIRVQRAVSSSSVTVMFRMDTIFVFHEIRVKPGPRRRS